MTALAADRVRFRNVTPFMPQRAKVGASKTIFQGSLIAVLAATGFVEAAFTSTTIKVIGVATKSVVSGAVAGAETVPYETGDFELENSAAGDLLTVADVGNIVFAVDDNTVAKTNGTSTRSAAGILVGFSPNNKPMVRVGLGLGST